MKLFEVEPIKQSNKTCRTCEHLQRWDFNGKIFMYCAIRKSGRTSNGLLKIKCKTIACNGYKSI